MKKGKIRASERASARAPEPKNRREKSAEQSLTGSAIVMRIDWSWRVAVCFAMDGQITVTGSGDSFAGCAWLIVDASQWQVSAQRPPRVDFGRIVGTDVVRAWKMQANNGNLVSMGKCMHYNRESFFFMRAIYLPLSDRTYDCQNLAFLLGVSLRPIISKCCLNMLTVFVLFLVRYKRDRIGLILKFYWVSMFCFHRWGQNSVRFHYFNLFPRKFTIRPRKCPRKDTIRQGKCQFTTQAHQIWHINYPNLIE